MSEKSRRDLANHEESAYMTRSYDLIIDLLNRMDQSVPYSLDPSGDVALRAAKRVRRLALRHGGELTIRDEADREFGLPQSRLEYHTRLAEPIYPAE
jgi:hypothetical protein